MTEGKIYFTKNQYHNLHGYTKVFWMMAEAKVAISLLCKHLNFLFGVKMKAEMFRLAKYNQSQEGAIELFWILLKNLLQLPSMENLVLSVKRYFLLELKYECIQFYSLPEDMSSGSRELLIALGYLLAHNYLEVLVTRSLEKSYLNPNILIKCNGSTLHKTENYSFNSEALKTEEDIQHAIEWVEGRIRFNKNAILEYNNSVPKMASKISKSILTTLPGIAELSHSEILALHNKSYATVFLEDTENTLKILQNHGCWLKNQSIFWEWMESVVLERKKELWVINTVELEKLSINLN